MEEGEEDEEEDGDGDDENSINDKIIFNKFYIDCWNIFSALKEKRLYSINKQILIHVQHLLIY